MTLFLRRSDLEQVADMAATIDRVEGAFSDIVSGAAEQPAPYSITGGSAASKFMVMAGVSHTRNIASAKLLADIPANRQHGLAVQRSLISLFSTIDGSCRAILDGRVPTRERTAAATAVATKHLSRPESSTLGLVGAGALAVAHVEAIRLVRPIDRVLVWSRSGATADSFRDRLALNGVGVEVCPSVESVAAASDILCTLTPSKAPVVDARWIRRGTHVNAVGAPPRRDHREIDSATVAMSDVFVDDLASALEKSGDVLLPIEEGVIDVAHVSTTLGDVVAGRHAGRVGDETITLYNSVGIGMLDLVVGAYYLERALALGLGIEINLAD